MQHAEIRIQPALTSSLIIAICALRLLTLPIPAVAACDYGPNTCLPGFVWRDAFQGDQTCVPGSTRDQAAQENSQAASRRDPAGGPFGPDQCLPGYVWREANAQDRVCVSGQSRAQAAQDNQLSSSRSDSVCRPLFGWADLHAHPFANEGFGGNSSVFFGRAFGDRNASLHRCDATHGVGGINDIAGMAMHVLYTSKFQWGHWTDGDTSYKGWPKWDDVTHQSMHEDWLKRAVDGGQRLLVALAVNNEWMCSTIKGVDMTAVNVAAAAALLIGGPSAAVGTVTSAAIVSAASTQATFLAGNVPSECKDMPSVDRQIGEAYAMQAAIDAKSGGPGTGWFRM